MIHPGPDVIQELGHKEDDGWDGIFTDLGFQYFPFHLENGKVKT